MTIRFGVVDLFSGPGGLGEGFASYRTTSGVVPYKLEMSVEKDGAAYQTLLLRSYLRHFSQAYPSAYYEWLNGDRPQEPNWRDHGAEEWDDACAETHHLELGGAEARRRVESEIRRIRRKYKDSTVLIGGPPCQAYSLAGRSRNAGNVEYVPENDKRHFLYEEYVSVLRMLEPSFFVMENVKGILTSAVRGDGIFYKIINDLENAVGSNSYQLIALAPASDCPVANDSPLPKDFVVRAEEHGVPQARHRVIIVGVRRDVAKTMLAGGMPRLVTKHRPESVSDVLLGMPMLRSGLSRGDDEDSWRAAIEESIDLLSGLQIPIGRAAHDLFLQNLAECRNSLGFVAGLGRSSSNSTAPYVKASEDLQKWLFDPELTRLSNHETRGHLPSDLSRYLFASVYAQTCGRSPKARDFPEKLAPNHKNWKSGKFSDRFRVQCWDRPATTITSHISKDGHYFIHPDSRQCRSLTVREAARIQTFSDNYFFKGSRTEQYVQVGNAVPPFLARQIAECLWKAFAQQSEIESPLASKEEAEEEEVRVVP